ncbi:MAG: hypothetical protein H8E46_05075 [FCB group bacterium]|nr:hypothetical protein [FCB group bacterium]
MKKLISKNVHWLLPAFFVCLIAAVSSADIIELEDGTEVYIGTAGEYTTYSYPDRTIYYDADWDEVKTGWIGSADYLDHPDAEITAAAMNHWRQEFAALIDAGGYNITVSDTSDNVIRQFTPVSARSSLTDLNDYARLLAKIIFQDQTLTIKNNDEIIYQGE